MILLQKRSLTGPKVRGKSTPKYKFYCRDGIIKKVIRLVLCLNEIVVVIKSTAA